MLCGFSGLNFLCAKVQRIFDLTKEKARKVSILGILTRSPWPAQKLYYFINKCCG